MAVNSVKQENINSNMQLRKSHLILLLTYSISFIWIVYFFVQNSHIGRILNQFYITTNVSFPQIYYTNYGDPSEKYVLLVAKVIDTILFTIMIFYFGRYILIHWLRYSREALSEFEEVHAIPSRIHKFFSSSSNGISFHHLLSTITLFIYFAMYFRIIFRMEEEDYIWSPSGSIATVLIRMSLFVILIEAFIITRLISSIQLHSFIRYSDATLAIMGYVGYNLIRFSDNELLLVLGISLLFPIIFVQVIVLSGLKKFQELILDQQTHLTETKVNLENSVKQKIATVNMGFVGQIFLSVIIQIMSVVSIYLFVDDYNTFVPPEDQIAMLNKFTISYLFVMMVIIVSIYYFGSTFSYSKLRNLFKRAVIVSTFLLTSLFLYDDWFFAVNEFMENRQILFFGNFAFLLLPAAVLTGLEIRLWVSTRDTN